MFLTHRIEEITQQREDTRRAIGLFVLEHREGIADYSGKDVAAATHSSIASVTRFAQTLGYRGWRDFVRDLSAEVSSAATRSTVDANRPFAPGADNAAIMGALQNLRADAVADTIRLLKPAVLEGAVRTLQRATTIHVFCTSPNTYLAGSFCRKFLSVGVPAHLAQIDERGLVANSLGPGDCALLISYSGANPDILPMSLVPILRAHRVPMVAITGEGNTYLRNNVPYSLTMSSQETLYAKVAGFSSETSASFLLDLLFSCYFARDFDALWERKTAIAGPLETGRTAPGA